MPRGGPRPGSGRPPGPSRATVERALKVQQAEAKARSENRELAKEVLERGMKLSEGAAATFRPAPNPATGQPDPSDPKWPLFGEWIDRMGFFAKELAKYQSPTFKAIMMAADAPSQVHDDRKTITLTIFEAGQPARMIEAPKKASNGG